MPAMRGGFKSPKGVRKPSSKGASPMSMPMGMGALPGGAMGGGMKPAPFKKGGMARKKK